MEQLQVLSLVLLALISGPILLYTTPVKCDTTKLLLTQDAVTWSGVWQSPKLSSGYGQIFARVDAHNHTDLLMTYQSYTLNGYQSVYSLRSVSLNGSNITISPHPLKRLIARLEPAVIRITEYNPTQGVCRGVYYATNGDSGTMAMVRVSAEEQKWISYCDITPWRTWLLVKIFNS